MRIAIVDAAKPGVVSRTAPVAAAVAQVFVSGGHIADTVRAADAGSGSGPRLSMYDFIVVIAKADSVFGALGAHVPNFLANAGMLGGKRSMALMMGAGPFAGKALARLMKAMESEGMMITCGELVRNAAEARRAAADAPLVRK